jgi:hypothetical protein
MFSSKRKKVADLDEVEDFLYEFLGDKLRVEAEDGSVEEVRPRSRAIPLLRSRLPRYGLTVVCVCGACAVVRVCAAQVSDILIDLYDSIYKDANIAPFEKLEKDWMAKQAKIAKTERPRRERSSSSTSSSSAAGMRCASHSSLEGGAVLVSRRESACLTTRAAAQVRHPRPRPRRRWR